MSEAKDTRAAGIEVAHTEAVAVVTFNRPQVRNALNLAAVQVLGQTLEELSRLPRVRAIVLIGAGGTFCAGADLADRAGTLGDADRDAAMMGAVSRVITALLTGPLPVVAAVQGAAAGVGASIALASDLVVAAEDGYFLLPFSGIGLIPDGGATATVAASIGRVRALRLALRRERFYAPEAYEAGLVAAVRAPETVRETAIAWATELSVGSAAANAAVKRLINAHAFGELGDLLGRETENQLRLLAGPDFREGVAAFLARRKPVFPDPASAPGRGPQGLSANPL
jgi:enoyl-CoA hydratase